MSQGDLFKTAQEPRRGKNGPREHYMSFAGWFAHPQEDIDVFVRLPKWRQQEILTTQRAFRADPTLVAFEVHDIKTGKAIPGQNVYQPPEGIYIKHDGPPPAVKYNVLDDIPFYVAKRHGGRKLRAEAEKLSPQERKELGYLF